MEWDFRVYAITTDDGVIDGTLAQDTEAGRADDVLRRSPASRETASATAGFREDGDGSDGDDIPEHDPLQVPGELSATGGTADAPDGTAKKEEIVLTITANANVPDQDSYRIDYSEDDGKTWKSLARDTSLTNFQGGRVYEDNAGLGYDQKRNYRVFAVGTDWRRNVGPALGTEGWTSKSGPPGEVTDVKASAPDLETITASWSAPEDNGGQPVTNYRYRYTLDDGDGVRDTNDFFDSASDRDSRPIGDWFNWEREPDGHHKGRPSLDQ